MVLREPIHRQLALAATAFFVFGFGLQLWRLEGFSASYDQGLFLQELWSGSQGRWFESTLSAELSAAVKLGGQLPQLGYLHASQHLNLLSQLWVPLIPIFGIYALPLVQVGLLTAGGLMLFKLAISEGLAAAIGLRIALAYYCSITLIGPLLENFHDLCPVPLLGFCLIWALRQGRCWPALGAALMITLVRGDAGIVSFSIGLWGVLRLPRRRLAAAVLIWSVFYVVLVTAWLQPLLGADVNERFLSEKFGQYQSAGGTLGLLLALAKQPQQLLQELVSPPGRSLEYLLAPMLPLALVPLFSIDVWLLIAAPLFIALAAKGFSALATGLRYVLYLAPGVFGGVVFWWRSHQGLYGSKWFRRLWTAAIALSLLLALSANPHRSLSALIPDSIKPWAQAGIQEQWSRRQAALAALAVIPPGASVAAHTPLLPRLAQRPVLLRYPFHSDFLNRQGKPQPVDWIALLPRFHRPFLAAFPEDRDQLLVLRARSLQLLDQGAYGVVHCADGALVLKRGAPSSSQSRACALEALAGNNIQ
ncbi:DUF2079 domain-containing protein [Synechococcus lacustris]|uniref:DUF2079 domain-containing protein n=1 Tax=Synechococcus lacustris TaxID=2116544 RepID=UPI0020CF90BB|nr:DUF2079 domain-containing protein [Synechococcus lacustris]MCP9922885.1 DUF2079 domain-containing protein [Synechococcus lacustris Cruz CV12-2]